MSQHICFLLVSLLGACTSQNIIVNTEYGQVQGETINLYNGRVNTTVHSFHGIPFAKDTSGLRRFQNPEPVDPWADVFVADAPGDACPQPTTVLSVTHPDWDRFSENCLHVDIVSPDVNGGLYPVMIWFHGGAYQEGANFQYPGHFLASQGLVIVTVNYRLGAFGFAFTGNAAAPGNAGLWDQKMGIEFVINNIANFGGDPTRITLFGESAGAGSVALQMLSPQSKDLFQQAITSSGAEVNFWTINRLESNPQDYIHQVADQLDCEDADDFAMIDCLQEKSWEEIHFNTTVTCTPGYPCNGMSPVVDGLGGFLPEDPENLRASGDIMRGPLMSGIMADDGGFNVVFWVPETIFGCCNRSDYLAAIRERLVAQWEPRIDNITAENMFQAIDFNYSPWPHVYDNETNRHAFVRMDTDRIFGYPWDQQIKAHSEIAPTYAYVFDYQGAVELGPEWIGVTHAEEVAFIWGNTLLEINEEVRDDSLIFNTTGYSQRDRDYTVFVMDLFANFAKYGNPTPEPVDDQLGGSVMWPQFYFDEMNILYLTNVSTNVVQQWEQKNYAFWTEHINYYLGTSS